MSDTYPKILVDEEGNPIPQVWDSDSEEWKPYESSAAIIQAIHSVVRKMEKDLRGLESNRPGAHEVEIGTTYWSVDTGDVSYSDGENWISMGAIE